jgi:hypothetical protein
MLTETASKLTPITMVTAIPIKFPSHFFVGLAPPVSSILSYADLRLIYPLIAKFLTLECTR